MGRDLQNFIAVRDMQPEDISAIYPEADLSGRNFLARQLALRDQGMCRVLAAVLEDMPVGYVFIFSSGSAAGIKNAPLPCIADLYVHADFRQMGIGSALMDAAEETAGQWSRSVFLDVCVGRRFGPAQRMYIARGYMPDGSGLYYQGKICEENAPVLNDDELFIRLIKKLR